MNEYIVQAGDTLSKIAAEKLGDASRWREIAQLNNLKEPYSIRPGQRLILAPAKLNIGGPVAPPNPILTTAPTEATLNSYVGKKIDVVCDSDYERDDDNHCAHFVSHVMGFTFGHTCKHETGKGEKGYCVRVHEVFTQCPTVGRWADRTANACLVFVILGAANVDLATKTMANIRRKHIGIYLNGTIWHYSNTQDKVVTQTPEAFSHHYPGDTAMFYGTFPR